MESFVEYVEVLVAFVQIERGPVIEAVGGRIAAARIGAGYMGPPYPDRRIVPGNSSLVAGGVEVRYLIAEFRLIGQYEETVRKARVVYPEMPQGPVLPCQ